MNMAVDIRRLLPGIGLPTLILHLSGNPWIDGTSSPPPDFTALRRVAETPFHTV